MLTDIRCRNAKPQAKPYKLADEKGLYLEVKPNGVKAWRYRFELVRDGVRKESVFAIGEYTSAPTGEPPEEAKLRRGGRRFTLAEAREERAKARALVKQGINPAHHRQTEQIKRAQERAITFEAVAREWVTLKDWEDVTKRRRLDMLQRVVFPKIGALPIKAVNPAHVLDVLKIASQKNGLTVAAEARRTMSGVFELAISTLRADTDPVYPVRKSVPTKKAERKRALSAQEIGQLLRDLAGYERNLQTVAAFYLMWFTLARPNEVIGAQWAEIELDGAVWRIPAERMKKRREHEVPLPRQAVALLRKMQGFTGHRAHVFPHRDDRTKPMTSATLRQALRYLGWSGRYSPHATRHTGSTRLNELGFSPKWIERQLAHGDPNVVRGTYDQSVHLADRAEMMQEWADLLASWAQGAEVVPLRRMA